MWEWILNVMGVVMVLMALGLVVVTVIDIYNEIF